MAAHKLPVALFLLLTLSFLPQAQGLTSTTLTLAVSPAPSVLGAPVTLSATVTPSNATGKVTFYDGVTVLGTKTLSGGSASFLTGLLPSGTRKLRAYYAGDSGNAAATSNVVTLTVNAKPSVGLVKGAFDGDSANGFVADFNGDGIADLALSSEVSFVWLGNGDGTFRIKVIGSGNPGQVGYPVAAADFNGDGKVDLLVAIGYPSALRFLAGNGDGTFQSGVQVAPAAFSPVVADFNGDGKPDLAVVTGNGISLLLGNGDGTFQSGITLNSAGLPTGAITGLWVGDFNGDGKPDLAIDTGSSISILLGMGDGTFQTPLNDPAVAAHPGVVVADLNGDGKADLIILSASSTKIAIQFGNGDGTFRPPVSYEVGFPPAGVAVGDFNGDGIADLAAGTSTTTSPASVSILLGNSDGTFQPPVNYPTYFAYAVVPIAADFNGDGKTDLYAGGIFFGTTMSLTATGGTPQSTPVGTAFPAQLQATLRNFSNPVTGASVTFNVAPAGGAGATVSSTTAITNSSGVALVTATANQQSGSYTVTATVQEVSASFALTNTVGPPAILTAVSGTPQPALPGTAFANALKVKLTDSAGNPWSGVTVTFTAPSAGATAMLSSSVVQTDASGVASVTATAGSVGGAYAVAASFGSLRALFSLTNVLSTTVTLAASPNPSIYGAPVTLTASVTPAGTTGKVTFYDGATVLGTRPLSSGMASLSTILLPTGSRRLSAYYSGDANYVAGTATFTQIVKSVPAVGFSAEGVLSLGSINPTGIAVGDFNGDGKADLAIPSVNGSASSVTILLGKGDGTFQPPISYPVPAAAFVVVADFNGDGNPDIAVTNYSGNGGISLLLGNGDGTFRSAINYSFIGIASGSLVAADFNGDGKPDLLMGIDILLGNGDGTFQAPVPISYTPSFQTIAVGDFNGDGKLDAVIANPFLQIAFGNGDGTFQPFSPFLNSTFVGSPLFLGDFNGDGNLDLVVSTNNGTSVLLGNGDGTFQSPISVPFAGNTIAASDFNGDGIADLVIVNSNTVSLLQGNGDGTFHLALSYSTTGRLPFLAAADFNGDGRVDLAGISSGISSGVAILLGVSSGVSFTVTGGNLQTAVTGAPFAVPLQVTVVQDGTPLNGAIVNFTAPSTGASAVLSATTAVTNTSGVASVNATANGVAGSYAVTATYKGLTVSFSLTNNTVGSVTATGGTPQYTLINSPFSKPLEVTVRDSAGNLAYGVRVTFTAPTSSAGLAFPPPGVVVTDASGVAKVSAYANSTVGSYTVTASAGGQSASFSLSNTSIKIVFASGGAPQSAPVGTAFPIPLQVTVLDSSGNPAPNTYVNFSAPQTGASATFPYGSTSVSASSNAAGVASVTATANNIPGAYTVTASVAGTGSTFSIPFTLTNLSSGSAGNSPNLALGKPATQSSTFPGYPSANASSAVDGNTDGNFSNGSVTATNLDTNAWWQVDLGSSAMINSVVIWNRTDCCGSRLNNFWVFVSDTPFSSTDNVSTLLGRQGTWSSPPTGAPNPSTTIPFTVQGRYVRVQLSGTNYLSLAEVQVFGALLSSNLAPGKTATQSSTLAGYPGAGPTSAADGNADGNFSDRSVTATNLDMNAWWQVDLGASAAVNTIVIWNRTDCCGERLNDYWVFVSDTPFLPTDTPTALQNRAGTFASHQTAAPNPFAVIPAGAQGRYVRVQLTGVNYLSLAEVQVFGTGGASTPTDMAQGKAATQSSTFPGYATDGAASAVDGNTDGNFGDGSVTATNLDPNPWWQVDLGASAAVSSIVVWNRTDCCGSRLNDYWVFVSDTPFGATDTPVTLQGRAGTFSSHQTAAPNPSATVAVGAQGRYVRVQLTGANYLSLAEVQVFGQ